MSQDVVVGYLHGTTVTQEFHHSLFGAYINDLWSGSRRILNFAPQVSAANICRARNDMVKQFLAQEKAQWLWILDQDAVFAPNMLPRLLASADPTERPIIGALAHQRRGKLDDKGAPIFDSFGAQEIEIVPTVYRLLWDQGMCVGYEEILNYTSGLLEVDATGCHCLLVHRCVFEAIKSDHPYRWFREDEWSPGGPILGEDIWFSMKARELGYPIYVDTTLESGHVKPFIMTSLMSKAERIT